MSQARLLAGLANWPALAGIAGLPATGWHPTVLWSRQDPRGDRTVIRLDRPGMAPVVVKQSHRDAETRNMAAGLAAQIAAARALQGHRSARVPQVLAHLPDARAALIEAVPGVPLADLLDGPDAGRAMARAGQWLDAFHRAGSPAQGTFFPRVTARRAMAAAKAFDDGQLQVARPAAFGRHIRALGVMANGLRRTGAMFAARHGDFSGRNLLVGTDAVWAIDFAPEARGVAALDVAKLLTFLALRAAGPVAGMLSGGAGCLRAAFDQGYGPGDPADPVLTFLLAAQLVSDWSAYPADTAAMTLAQRTRFDRIAGLLADLAA